jgi:diacylglycerol kinase family enzyme
MTRALLITNPVAARVESAAVRAVTETLRAGGWTVDVMATTHPRDAGRYAAEAPGGGVDVVVSYGGDGTAIDIAAALLGSGIPLGIVPAGTGNLLAANLGLPRHPVAAAHAMLTGAPRRVDLGVVPRPDGVRYFAVAAGAGFDAELMARTAAPEKRRWKMGAYVARAFEMLPRVNSARYRVTIDGTAHEISAAMLLVANCGQILPPLVRLRPDVQPDDGWLDVLALRANGAIDGVRAMWELLWATWKPSPPAGPLERANGAARVWFGRGRAIAVEVVAGPPQPVQLDGDVAGETPFEARVLPGGLSVLSPAVPSSEPARSAS